MTKNRGVRKPLQYRVLGIYWDIFLRVNTYDKWYQLINPLKTKRKHL